MEAERQCRKEMLIEEHTTNFKAICDGVWLLNLSAELFLLELIKAVLSPCVLLSKYLTAEGLFSAKHLLTVSKSYYSTSVCRLPYGSEASWVASLAPTMFVCWSVS